MRLPIPTAKPDAHHLSARGRTHGRVHTTKAHIEPHPMLKNDAFNICNKDGSPIDIFTCTEDPMVLEKVSARIERIEATDNTVSCHRIERRRQCPLRESSSR